MANKIIEGTKKDIQIGNYKIISGYVVYNKIEKAYFDEDENWRDIEEVNVYKNLEDAKDEIENFDEARPHTRDFSHELGRLYIC